jgi:ATP-dependent Clp protease ATP-binding subunit ClpC
MFERFTERGRQVVVLAQDEARTLKHNYIGTEHLLLGLVREEDGLAARVLDTLDVTIEEARAQVVRVVGTGTEIDAGAIPFTPRARKVLDMALEESRALGHTYIGTEHILLALVSENEGVGARILRDLDADAETVRDELLRMLSGPGRRLRPASRVRQVLIACPACGERIETVTTDRPGTSGEVAAEGDRTCPACGKRWTISYTVSWRESSS